ncbi:hypothetical protein ACHAWO_005021 [Cyclotella atomus]|uniref:Uncharacterized protein n=1 Tax=Cyclotella atomus TaxID=382360 RepID=A0ABD3PTT6_9STRA
MNSLIARSFCRKAQPAIRSFSSSGGSIPTTSTVQSGSYKVVGLDHLSTPEMNAQYRTKYWLSDPACYPIMIILGGAVSMCAGFGLHFFFTSPDVQITPGRRNKMIRDWK